MLALRTLPFDANTNALISLQTCKFHHGKHHSTYVSKLNELVADTAFETLELHEIILCLPDMIKAARNSDDTKSVTKFEATFNNATQVYNHDFYFDCIAGASEISADLDGAIKCAFSDFRAEFIAKALAHFGSGWCWLVCDERGGNLEILTTQNADCPLIARKIPLLVCDLWEHAYYLDYQNSRKDYLEKFMDNIDWTFVSSAYYWACKDGFSSVGSYVADVHPHAHDGRYRCGMCDN